MSKSVSTKGKSTIKVLQIVAPQAYSQVNIFQRLTAHSLHPINELKDILKELFHSINEESRKQFETIFQLEEKLKKANYQSEEPVRLDMPSTSKKIFFNPKPYEKVPISEYKIVDKETFNSGPFYRAEDISKKVFTALRQTGKSYFDAYQNDPKAEENRDNPIYTLPNMLVSNIGADIYYNRLVSGEGANADDEKREDSPSSSSSSSPSSSPAPSSSASTSTTPSFTSPDKLKEALLQLHFVVATVLQRAEAARQDRELLIHTMQNTLEDIENEQAIAERQNEPESDGEGEGEGEEEGK